MSSAATYFLLFFKQAKFFRQDYLKWKPVEILLLHKLSCFIFFKNHHYQILRTWEQQQIGPFLHLVELLNSNKVVYNNWTSNSCNSKMQLTH